MMHYFFMQTSQDMQSPLKACKRKAEEKVQEGERKGETEDKGRKSRREADIKVCCIVGEREQFTGAETQLLIQNETFSWASAVQTSVCKR